MTRKALRQRLIAQVVLEHLLYPELTSTELFQKINKAVPQYDKTIHNIIVKHINKLGLWKKL